MNNTTSYYLCFSIITDAANAERISDWFMLADALSVSQQDAKDNAIFQINPQDQPLWQQVKITALFLGDIPPQPIARALKQFCHNDQLTIHWELLEEQDWVRLTQAQFQPQCYENKLWICPRWHDAQSLSGTVVTLDPGLAFGTGTHPTTALCLSWLAKESLLDKQLIDYGCGSGILALSALALGAKCVWATDHDEQALLATRNNAALNRFITPNNLLTTAPAELPQINVDIVVANILSQPLIALANTLMALLNERGVLVLSGILSEECDDVAQAYQPHLIVDSMRHEQGWARIVFKRSESS